MTDAQFQDIQLWRRVCFGHTANKTEGAIVYLFKWQ
jgi:hypothetical protein